MKRILSFLLAVAVFLITLSGCAAGERKQKCTVVELTEENLWRYVAVSLDTDFVPAQSDGALECSVNGVLDWALYENVVLTFDVVYYKPNAAGPEHKHYSVDIALNAAGDARFEVPYTGLAQICGGTGAVTEWGDTSELYWYNRILQLKSVAGTVICTA